MLIAEKLLRLLLSEDSGAVRHRVRVPEALAAALVAELALDGLVGFNPVKDAFVVAAEHEPVPDPVLAAALDVLGTTPVPVSLGIGKLARQVAPAVEDLVAARQEDVSGPVAAVLVEGREPEDDASTVLIALLAVLEQADRVVDHPASPGRAVNARALEVAGSDWATPQVRATVRAACATAVSSPWTGAIDRVVADWR